jgi:hypothetical protein
MIPRVLPLFALIATTGAAVLAAEDAAKTVSIPKEQRVAATVTLLTDTGTTGKGSPIYKGYRPQVRFSGETGVVSCVLGLPDEKMEPGETAQVSLKCIEDFKVRVDKLEFDMFEGGRKVGRGVLHAPSPLKRRNRRCCPRDTGALRRCKCSRCHSASLRFAPCSASRLARPSPPISPFQWTSGLRRGMERPLAEPASSVCSGVRAPRPAFPLPPENLR